MPYHFLLQNRVKQEGIKINRGILVAKPRHEEGDFSFERRQNVVFYKIGGLLYLFELTTRFAFSTDFKDGILRAEISFA